MATGRPRGVAVQAAAAGDDRQPALARDAVQRELPAEQLRDRRHRGLGDRHGGEGAEHRDAGGLRVVALRLGADDRLLDPARAAFEDLPVLVDEEVVADVVPAVGVAVVLGDGEHHRGRLVGRVVVGGDGVMDEGHLHHAVVGRRARRHGGGAPRRARDDRRRRPGRGAACCLGLAAARATGDRRPAAGTETKCTRSAPRSGREARSCSSSQPPAQTGSEARSPVPVSGAWSPWTASATHGLQRPAAPAHAHLEAPARRVRAAHAEQVEAPRRAQHPARGALEVPGARRPCRSRVPVPARPCPRALNGRTSSDPRPAAAPRTRARRRVIVVPPTAARVARRAEDATPARSPATCLGLARPARVAVARRRPR